MGFLFSKFWTKLLGNIEIRIIMIGLDAAGKTTISYKLKMGDNLKNLHPIGFGVKTLYYKNLNFTIWDVCCQDKIRVLWRHYYQNTDGLVLVVDSNDRERIDEANIELKKNVGRRRIKRLRTFSYG